MQEQQSVSFLQLVAQVVVALIIQAPVIAAAAFVIFHAVKRGVVAGRKAELSKKKHKRHSESESESRALRGV